MSGYAKRLTGIVVGTAIVCVLLGLYIGLYLTSGGRCCLSTAMSDAEINTYLRTVEDFLAELTH